MPTDQFEELILRTGTYYGECMGYCSDRLTVTRTGMLYESLPNTEDESYPVRSVVEPIDPEEWATLTGVFDPRALDELPDTIGCPDCYDQGGGIRRVRAPRNRPPRGPRARCRRP